MSSRRVTTKKYKNNHFLAFEIHSKSTELKSLHWILKLLSKPDHFGASECLSLCDDLLFHVCFTFLKLFVSPPEGSTNTKQANQQAAKAALQGLCGVLGNREVMKENYVGALNELLQASSLGKASFAVTETPEKGVTWVGNDQEAHLLPADTSVTPETQATPTKPRERNVSGRN